MFICFDIPQFIYADIISLMEQQDKGIHTAWRLKKKLQGFGVPILLHMIRYIFSRFDIFRCIKTE